MPPTGPPPSTPTPEATPLNIPNLISYPLAPVSRPTTIKTLAQTTTSFTLHPPCPPEPPSHQLPHPSSRLVHVLFNTGEWSTRRAAKLNLILQPQPPLPGYLAQLLQDRIQQALSKRHSFPKPFALCLDHLLDDITPPGRNVSVDKLLAVANQSFAESTCDVIRSHLERALQQRRIQLSHFDITDFEHEAQSVHRKLSNKLGTHLHSFARNPCSPV